MRGLILTWCVLAVAGAMQVHEAAAVALSDNAPQLRRGNEIDYISGGIGSDEAAVMRRRAGQFKVRLRFLDRTDGSALSDVSVTLFDARREIVLQVLSEGPYLYLNPPPGTYRAVVRYGGVIACHHFTVSAAGRATDLVLRLPALPLADEGPSAATGSTARGGCRGAGGPCCGLDWAL